ncbi:GGDEF domain-containing protein [Neobacillus sp. D3-1R]|uniref:GGDEF domain-containing protein n=1 Tax=Neobacillus sp. D3-1R TaxID=3445778 RepID=UPI003FA001D0
MKYSLYLNDYQTEKLFSILRWVFLGISIILFYVPPISTILGFNHTTFPILLSVGILYMTLSQIALNRIKPEDEWFKKITKLGIVFDYIALIWLLALTGGVESYLFPISYLLIMHATIYWKTKGAFISSLAVSIGYTAIYLILDNGLDHIFLYLINSFFTWIVGLFGSLIVLRERKHMKQKEIYQELLVQDYLTGLYNHRHFQENLAYLSLNQTEFTLIMGDIDDFKQINDKYGHLVGDEVLKQLGKTIQTLVDKFNGHAFRYGGEEFAIILEQTTENQIKLFLNDLYKELHLTTYTDEKWSITMSFGVALSHSAPTHSHLLAEADGLLYEAKAKGRNCACFKSGTVYVNEYNLSERNLISS